MEIYKIPACWPSSFVYGIPISGHKFFKIDMLLKENIVEYKIKNNQMNTIKLDVNLLDFIFQFCNVN